jgi:general secretion pathway protein K
MRQAKANKGSALLTALFIMTIAAIVATAMSMRAQLDIYRTKLLIDHDKLYLASQALTFWAQNELSIKENKFSKVDSHNRVAIYPSKMASIYSKEITINGGLYDLQSRFNLNNVSDKKSVILFVNLIEALYPKTSDQDKINFIVALQDWLRPYDLDRGKDSFMSYYLSQDPPYYPSHQQMKSVSEFRLIKDVNASLDLSIRPYITALPEPTQININTASLPVLRSLGDGLSESQAKEIIDARKVDGIKNVQEIIPLLKKLNITNQQVALESQYFLSVASVKNSDSNLTVYTLFKRIHSKDGKVNVGVLRQSMNVF